jgi:hypothetical protein
MRLRRATTRAMTTRSLERALKVERDSALTSAVRMERTFAAYALRFGHKHELEERYMRLARERLQLLDDILAVLGDAD